MSHTLCTNTNFFLVSRICTLSLSVYNFCSFLQTVRVPRASLANHLHPPNMGCCYLPYFHVRKLRLEEIFRALVSHRASSHLYGDLVSVHQQVIPRPQQIRQLERGIRGATRRRDGRRFTFTRRTSGDLVAKVYLVHHVTAVVADSSLALSIDVDTLRMMTHYTLPQRMIAQTMCVLFFASVEHC